MRERWKDIEGYEGIYKVSNFGNVYSFISNKNLSVQPTANNGYPMVDLFKDKQSKMMLVHRLVATAFIPNPKQKPQVNHIDHDRANNDVSNLEWCTPSENIKHCFNNGRHPGSGLKGTQMHTAKLNELQVRIIKKSSKEELTGVYLAKTFGVSHTVIYKIRRKEIWKHV